MSNRASIKDIEGASQRNEKEAADATANRGTGQVDIEGGEDKGRSGEGVIEQDQDEAPQLDGDQEDG